MGQHVFLDRGVGDGGVGDSLGSSDEGCSRLRIWPMSKS